MLPDLRGRQFADTCEFVDGGLGHTKKACHFLDRQDLAIRCVCLCHDRCGHRIIHSEWVIGVLDRKLEGVLASNSTAGISVLSIGVCRAMRERLRLRFRGSTADEVLDIHR